MIIRLKQGIGRLIRSDKDFGIVSIIDSRVGDKFNNKYKKMIWDAPPIKNRTSDITEISNFYNFLL
jgi:ATP-dependent DNA helicase DinG